jgi:outer membrane protein assembly factor BamD
MKKLLFPALLSLLICACSSNDDDKQISTAAPEGSQELVQQEEGKATRLYEKARENLDKGYYKTAIQNFQDIERLYPFSNLAPKAKVMSAYAYFKDEEYDEAIALIDNFVRLNPGNEDVSFMYYLKAMSYYQQITDIKRDQQVTKLALESLEEIRSRFPGTDYDRDAKFKIALIRDHLAGKDMEVGRYYLKQSKNNAALNRFQSVVRDYQDTPQIEEALYRMVEVNLMIGIKEEAVKYASILGHNYPSSKWYKYALGLVKETGSVDVQEKGGKWTDFITRSTNRAPQNEITPSPAPLDLEQSEQNVDDVINKVFE